MKKLILLSFIIGLSFSSLQLEAQLSKKAQYQTLYQKKMEKIEKQYKAMDPKSQMNITSVQGNPASSEDYYWMDEDWLHATNTTFTYNEMGYMTEHLTTDATTGEGLYKYSFEFDSHQNQVKFIYSEWVEDAWIIFFGFSNENTYDESGNVIEQVSQFYDNGLMEWVNSWKYLAVYEDGDDLLEEQFQFWNGAAWQYDFKQVYTVDEGGVWTSVTGYMANGENWTEDFRLIDWVWQDWENWIESSATYQEWMDEMWVDVERFSSEFSENGYLRTHETIDNGEWVPFFRINYSETPSEQVYIYENNDSGDWVGTERNTSYFDDHQNFAGFKFEVSESDSWIIVFYYAVTNTYDEYDQVVEVVIQQWSDEDQMLFNVEKHVYSNFLTGIGEKVSGLDLNIFPNPVASVLEIGNAGSLPEYTRYRLVDMNGSVVREGQLINGKQSLDMSELRTGMYFLNVNTPDNMSSSFKVLKK